MTTAELSGKSNDGNHNWRLGYNFKWERQGITASTGVYAHTVEANPVWLKHNGSQGYTFNTGGEYYDTHEVKTALYASDDWQVTAGGCRQVLVWSIILLADKMQWLI